MTPLRLATWNVPHRIHLENWSEPLILRSPDEAARLKAIVDWLRARFAAGLDVACLPEVSGDRVARLRAGLAGTVTLQSFTDPRVPARATRFRRRPGCTSRVRLSSRASPPVAPCADATPRPSPTFPARATWRSTLATCSS